MIDKQSKLGGYIVHQHHFLCMLSQEEGIHIETQRNKFLFENTSTEGGQSIFENKLKEVSRRFPGDFQEIYGRFPGVRYTAVMEQGL